VSYIFEGFQPENLWKHFYDLNQIPRESKHEEEVSNWLVDFAENLDLEVEQDQLGNVRIKKPGDLSGPTVCLQGHMDMVCEKEDEVEHDFRNDPIPMKIEDGWVTADGTSLGADNGIGIAAALALMEEDFSHPPLEFLFTVDEETGLTGAMEMSEDFVSADILINCDSEDWGIFTIGCAGGRNTKIELDINRKPKPSDKKALKLEIRGLKGGHSGMDIDKGRANAIEQLNRLTAWLDEKFDIDLVDFKAGDAHNAIPRYAEGYIFINGSSLEEINKLCKKFDWEVNQEYGKKENKIVIKTEKVELDKQPLSNESKSKFINLIKGIPHGVIAMSPDIEDMVQTSTNLAVVEIEDGRAQILTSQRSSVSSQKDEISYRVKAVADLAGAKTEFSGDYPGWEPNPDSEILHVMKEVYRELYNEEPIHEAVHAGLETGIIGKRVPGIDMVSFGPTIENPHSPSERLKIETVDKFWELLKETLNKLGEE